jgi:hypothetical protein
MYIGRTDHHARLGDAREACCIASDSEVEQGTTREMSRNAEEDVRRLQIAMDDATLVGAIERARDPPKQRYRNVDRQSGFLWKGTRRDRRIEATP